MKRIASLVLLSGLTVFAISCDGKGENGIEAKSIEQLHAENGVPVRILTVEPRPFTSEFSYYSIITGYEETTASAMISDKVESIRYKVGDRVDKDDVVVTFPTDNHAAQYFQAKVAYEHAETTLKRIKNLYENGGISLQEYDNTKTQYEVALANWDAVRQTVTVKAPISGIITNIAVRESDNVNPGDILFTVSRTQKLKTRIWVSENRVADITVGNSATATWRDVTITGKVVQADMSLDTSKQAFGVVVEFDNPGNSMMSGVNAEVILHGREDAEVIVIERKNILNDGESDYVFLAENGVAVRQDVITGRSIGLEVEIVEGLHPGDRLITEGQMLLEDNMKISVKN